MDHIFALKSFCSGFWKFYLMNRGFAWLCGLPYNRDVGVMREERLLVAEILFLNFF